VQRNDKTMLQLRRQTAAVGDQADKDFRSCTNRVQRSRSRSFFVQIPPANIQAYFGLWPQEASPLLPRSLRKKGSLCSDAHLTGVIHTAEGKRSIDDDLVICIDRHAEKRQRDDDRSSPVRFSGRRRHGGSF
jgi:hypothetical protein